MINAKLDFKKKKDFSGNTNLTFIQLFLAIL